MPYAKDNRRKVRSIFFVSVIALLLLSLFSGSRDEASAYPAGWSDDRRLTFDPDSSMTPVSTVDPDNNIYLVWDDDRDGNEEIYFKKSTNWGKTWGSDVRLTNDAYISNDPDIAADSSGIIHVVWREQRSSIVHVNYMNSSDGGNTWSPIKQLFSRNGDASTSVGPIIHTPHVRIGENDVVHVVFSDDPNPATTYNGHTTYVKYMNSTDSGLTWSSTRNIGVTRDVARRNTFAANTEGNLYVAFEDWSAGRTHVYFTNSIDNGGTWTPEITLITGSYDSWNARIAAGKAGIVFISWDDNRNSDWDIYCRVSTNAASTWSTDIRVSNTADYQRGSAVDVDSTGNASIVWQDKRDGGNNELYYAKVDMTGTILLNDLRLTIDPANSSSPWTMVDTLDVIHLFWADDRDGNYEIYYKSTGICILNIMAIPNPQEVFGNVNISAEVSSNFNIMGVWVEVFDPYGAPNGNFSMSYDSIDDRYYLNQSYYVLGNFTFTIWANDSVGDWGWASSGFTIHDTTPPDITDITTVPNPQEVYGSVNISTIITDNVMVFAAWVEVYDPAIGNIGNFTMLYDSSNGRYYWNVPGNLIGTYTFTIQANDTSDNWAASPGFFFVQDTTPPSITGVTAFPDPQEVFFSVNVSAVVTDNYELFGVWVDMRNPNANPVGNFTMLYDPANDRYYWVQDYDIIGTYTFTVWANDSQNNWASVSGVFAIQDTTPPVISDITAIPDTQEVFSWVNVSANITDNYQLSGTVVEIYDPLGIFVGNFTLLDGMTPERFYLNQSYDIVGTYTFTVWANDISDNLASEGGSFVIQDTAPPIIGDVDAQPNPQEVHGYVNISANVTDNYQVRGVRVEIFDPDDDFLGNYSMIYDQSTDRYFWEQEYGMLGSYAFTIWVNDTSDNWASALGMFSIQDTTPPEISDLTVIPDPQEVYGGINISCEVTDNYRVEGVSIEIFDPIGNTLGNFSMTYDRPLDRYDLYQVCNLLGSYSFTVWAWDSSFNLASAPGSFDIHDTTPPLIIQTSVEPDPQDVFADVNLTAVIEDNYQLYGAWIEITDPDGNYIGNHTMQYHDQDQVFYREQNCNAIGIYTYTVWANDTSDNWASSSDSFFIHDTVPPLIMDAVAVPDPQEVFDFVNISANVTDNYQISGVWVAIYEPDGTLLGNYSMFVGLNGSYYLYQDYSVIGIHIYHIYAKDTSDNWNSATGLFLIHDITPPEISDVLITPDPQDVLKPIEISAIVTDNYILYGTWLEVHNPEGVLIGNFSKSGGVWGGLFHWNQTYEKAGTYSFTIWANDTSNNWAHYEGHFTVEYHPEPEEYNWKPIIALVFAFILIVLGILISQSRPVNFTGAPEKDRWYTFTGLALPYIVAEAITGIISYFTGMLSVPPLMGVGLIVDLVILIAGMICLLVIFMKGKPSPPSGEEKPPETPLMPPPPPQEEIGPVFPLGPPPYAEEPIPPPPPPIEEPPPPPPLNGSEATESPTEKGGM